MALNKGLVTEATPLTFPVDATTDELNVTLERNGARAKRRGFNIEVDGTVSAEAVPDYSSFMSYPWDFAGGNKDSSFLVLQSNLCLCFYNIREMPISSGLHPQSIDLRPFMTAGAPADVRVSVASVKGQIVVAGEGINTFRVQYDKDTDTFSTEEVTFRVRDFEFTHNKQFLREEDLASPPVTRRYDTLNAGWKQSQLDSFVSRFSVYPALTKPAFCSKNSSGEWDPMDWGNTEGGNTLITNGHYILNLYQMDRDSASGLSGVNASAAAMGLSEEKTRFTTVTGYAGRIFYSGMVSKRSNGRVYFSQVIQDGNELGELFSVNDPTAEYLSDLLDTDGGYIDLPDAEGITKLHVFGTQLLVFASNGVWAISGVDDVFRATEYAVNKVTTTGLVSQSTFVSAEGRPYWWSAYGIHTITISETRVLQEVSVSDPSIKTFFQSIPPVVRSLATGSYDATNRQVVWLYGVEGGESKFTNLLLLDENFGAFAPWAISTDLVNGPFIVSSFMNRFLPLEVSTDTVVDSDGEVVVDSLGEPIVVTNTNYTNRSSNLTFVFVDEDGKLGFGLFRDNDLVDFGEFDYEAYLETGYNYLTDLSTLKSTPYVTVLCKRTETVWGPDFVPEQQSSLKVSSYWDFKATPSFLPQEVYKIRRYVFPTTVGEAFQSEHSNVQTKIVPRGRGKSIKLRFFSEAKKDFYLIGFETVDAKNPTI